MVWGVVNGWLRAKYQRLGLNSSVRLGAGAAWCSSVHAKRDRPYPLPGGDGAVWTPCEGHNGLGDRMFEQIGKSGSGVPGPFLLPSHFLP